MLHPPRLPLPAIDRASAPRRPPWLKHPPATTTPPPRPPRPDPTRSRSVQNRRRVRLLINHGLTYWRKQRRDGALRELGRPRGRKPVDRRERETAELRCRAERAEAELEKAKKVIEIQGNLSALLEQMLGTASASASTER